MTIPFVYLPNTFGEWVEITNNVISELNNSNNFVLVSQNATPVVSTGNVSINGTATIAIVAAQTLLGNGIAVTSLNASNLTVGTVPSSRLVGTYNLLTANDTTYAYGKTEGALNVNSAVTATTAGTANNATYAYGKPESELAVNTAILAQTANNATYAFGKTEGALNVNSAVSANNATYAFGKTEGALNVNTASYLGGSLISGNTTALLVGNSSVYTLITDTLITGNGAGLTSLNASAITTGTIGDGRLPVANGTANGIITTTTQSVAGDKTFLNDVTISGNLVVSGGATFINTTSLSVADNIITLNSDVSPVTAPTEDAGIEINRGSSANVVFKWDETLDTWRLTRDGTIYGTIPTTDETSNASNLSSGTIPSGRLTGAYDITANNATYAYGKTESSLNVNSASTANNATYAYGKTEGALNVNSAASATTATSATAATTAETANNATYAFGKTENALNVNNATTATTATTANNATYAYGKTEGALNVNSATTATTANNATYAFGKTEGALNVNSATTATTANNATYVYGKTEGALNVNSAIFLSGNTITTNSTVLAVGANVFLDTTTLFIGNTSVNTVATGGQITFSGTVINSTMFTATANNATYAYGKTEGALNANSAATALSVNTTSTITAALGSISANTVLTNYSATWNNASVAFTGIYENITDTASATGSLLIDLGVGGVSKFKVDKSGTIYINGSAWMDPIVAAIALG